jgi:hypothetical protein
MEKGETVLLPCLLLLFAGVGKFNIVADDSNAGYKRTHKRMRMTLALGSRFKWWLSAQASG